MSNNGSLIIDRGAYFAKMTVDIFYQSYRQYVKYILWSSIRFFCWGFVISMICSRRSKFGV